MKPHIEEYEDDDIRIVVSKGPMLNS